ncbi:hemerythrin domain-containing protein [Shewanella fidelis]|uniref:Hemerythrin domain-containing protein n=1 Tax=Shewanella fidelis TaxID=173509 RepID=A0AAW8NNG6_9GAMM|nr:hemerythrin domain-containing protein [Shewanella fidelis]MDR8524743.1 hemerythrin domain-containing protein [Shewanella fidelis]MDW4810814.1 hemerythrin domain-containing protein [Shewanella fidelis]MDW4815407.1 hemerythrin domain-containing protein [Shewanella fidelis]MDW4819497.1 hemerythrin domain-containing protein [Shewanella fidelis]MDW4822825.1 hemerythrin domain-containing protein [Shewanella fidelis]
MLARLMHDHKHIAKLLTILSMKCNKLTAGEQINYNVVRDIVEYMQSYAEHSHHPLEDIISEFYISKFSSPSSADLLLAEHEALSHASTSLMATLNLILNDVVVPKEQLVLELQSYVQLQQNHMEYEESSIFPKWRKTMSDSDWYAVSSMCNERLIDDPLFAESGAVLFEELREYLATTDSD